MVQTCLLMCFWWPLLVDNMKWYTKTCHECQIHQMQQLHIPPTVLVLGGLFCKVHIDMMVMPRSGLYHFIIEAQCILRAYLKWCMLRSENAAAITSFILEDILCCWGEISKLVTDNGSPYIQALDILASQYRIHHVWISPYNFQANRVVK